MNPADTTPAEPTIALRLKGLLHAMSITQRSVFAGALTVCALLISGAAIAPVRSLVTSGAGAVAVAQASPSAGVGGDPSAGVMLADGPAALAGLAVSRQLPGRRAFLATQMAFLGETGSEIQFGDDTLLPHSGAGSEESGDLLQDGTVLGRMGNRGGFGAGGQPTGLAGAMTAAWIGAAGGAPGSDYASAAGSGAGSGATGRAGGAGASNAAGNAQITDCGSGKSCAAPVLVLAQAPPALVKPGKEHDDTPATTPGRPDGGSPVVSQPGAGSDTPPPKSSPIIVKNLPATLEQDVLLLAAVDLPAVAVPEPGSIALLVAGVALLLMAARRRLQHSA